MTPAWLPDDFIPPARAVLIGHLHLRPIRAADVTIDFPAVMGSRERLWAKYGEAWGWPPADMTPEEDEADLARHEREIAARETFNYALLNSEETELLGCVYLDPPADPGECDVQVSWWVIDEYAGTELEAELDAFVPRWVTTAWPFTNPLVWP